MPRIELPKRFPLYSPFQSRSGNLPLTKDCRLINGYVEYDPSDREYWIYKRPGLSVNNSILTAAGAGLGIYQSPSIAGLFSLFAVNGGTLTQGGSTLTNFIVPRFNQPYIFETINSNPLTVVMVSPFTQYLISPSTNFLPGGNVLDITSLIPATSGINLPSLAVGSAYLDGTLYVMDTKGNIFGSNLNDASIWNPLNVIAASATSDQGMAIAKQLNYVIAFKQTAAQVFFNNSNPAPGSPLSQVPDSIIPLGCYAPYSVKGIDNSLFWVSSNESVSPQVVQLDALVPKVISTPAVERILEGAQVDTQFGGDGITGWTLKLGGHRYYGMLIFNLNICLVYDIDQQAWYIWTDASGSNPFPAIGTSYQGALATGISGPHIIQTANGKIYNIDSKNTNDNGLLFPVDIYTPNFDGGVDRQKTLNLLKFNADMYAGSVLNVRYNDNDFDEEDWSNFRNIDLDQERPFIDNEGSFYRRAYHLRHLCNTPLRIKSGDLSLSLGSL